MKLTIPSTPPIPLELLAQALASIGLVLDSRREPDGTHHAIWASDKAQGLDLSGRPDVERVITEALGAARAIEREGVRRPPAARTAHEGPQPLPGNVCRCHDAECPERASCLRWIHRDTGPGPSPHSWSLRQPQNPWADHDHHPDPWELEQPNEPQDPGPCPYYFSEE